MRIDNHTPTTVLVTGGTGAIGSFVVEELVEHGHEVIVYTRRSGPVTDAVDHAAVQYVMGTLEDAEYLAGVLREHEVSHLIHLAALVSSLPGPTGEAASIQANVVSTASVCGAAAVAGVRRVVAMSSKAVYGDVDVADGVAVGETALPVRPVDPYGLSKMLAEEVAEYFRRVHSLDVVIVRAATTVGPGKGAQHGNTACTSTIIEGTWKREPVRIPDGGDAVDDLIYNGDLAIGLVQLCFAPRLSHRVYHLSSGKPYGLRALAEDVRRIVPSADIEIGSGHDFFHLGHNLHVVLENSAARADLGFTPRPPSEWLRDYFARLSARAARNPSTTRERSM